MPTVGDILRAEREKQNMTVKDIEKATSIRAIYIQAIEDGKYDVLPGEVYLKGFIRNYASFLGLNPQAVLEVYRDSQSPPPPAAPAAPPAMPPKVERGKEEPGAHSIGRWVIVLVVLAVIAGAAWAAIEYFNQPAPPPAKPPQAQVQPPAPAPAPTPTPTAQKPVTPAPGTRPIVVVAKYTAECWTRVTADGREVYEGIPRPDETLTWNANQTMTVHVGNAAGIDLTYNGQPQGRLGGDGDVISKTFTANTTIQSGTTGTPTGTPRQ